MRHPHHLQRLAPLGAAPPPAGDAARGSSGSAGSGPRRWFPRHRQAVARVALASATLSSMGVMTAANLGEANAFELALRPAITELLAASTPAPFSAAGPTGGPGGGHPAPAVPA
ncbi:MAG: hypothetical protein ACR2K0_03075, partial [Acidimicrobiales bacterium]